MVQKYLLVGYGNFAAVKGNRCSNASAGSVTVSKNISNTNHSIQTKNMKKKLV